MPGNDYLLNNDGSIDYLDLLSELVVEDEKWDL